MGQGYSMTALSAVAVTIDVPELADLIHEKTLASARFMKSVRARTQQGFVFVKAVQKPYASFDVRGYVKQIAEERLALAGIPNALGFQRIIESGNAGFLVRQYMYSSVYDRFSTRPFLEDIERKWIAFQLLCAVRDCHARNIYHGDIKTENLLVTSWNWLYLTDFSSAFKPVALPEDNPADFFFYFDTSSRRTCYIAPERFTETGSEDAPTELNWAMDMFSVGCTLAEIFLEAPIFTLSQIFKYRAGDYSPEHTHLNKIEDMEVRAMLLNMIDLDPEKRYSAEQHLSFYKGKIFPEYFYGFLHQYMQDLTEPTVENQPIRLELSILNESDHKIEKVYQDFDKISYFLGTSSALDESRPISTLRSRSSGTLSKNRPSLESESSIHDGSLLFLTLVSSGLRNTGKASARLKACDLLVAFSERLPDEAKLDRILPYVAGLLSDRTDSVKVAALQAVTAILESVEVVSPINAYLFPEYIFPKLRQFLGGPQGQASAIVRAAYASSLASLALSSARMLDMVQAIRADGRIPSLSNNGWDPETSFHGLYDVARADLVPHFEEATTMLITDEDTSVRRALLGSVSRLCIFFGSAKSSDVILSHLNTYLNDKDWMLRCSFFEALVGVALYVGSSSLENFILPIMVGSLTDPEIFVVEKVIRSLSRMAALGLFQKSLSWQLVSIASRYLVHPSIWVREAAAQFIAQSCKYLKAADKYCIIMPILKPFLRVSIADVTEQLMLDNLKAPLSKGVFEAAVLWATRKEKSLFWTAANRDGLFSLSDGDSPMNPINLNRQLSTRIPPSQRDKDDNTALETLRNLGMTPDDEIKLLALREYIFRVAARRGTDAPPELHLTLNSIVSLTQIGVTPQNVFFDQREPIREVKTRPHAKHRRAERDERHTLADALLDASTTLDETGLRRPLTYNRNDDVATPSSSEPTDIQHIRGSRIEREHAGMDRQNIRIESIKDTDARRSSSANGRHNLLEADRLSVRNQPLSLQHRSSAISLMSRVETMKADAEISTTPETAFGRLDGQTYQRSSAAPSAVALTAEATDKHRGKSPGRASAMSTTFEANHSYTGNDPHVLRLLDSHFVENFPIDLLDFGQARSSVDTVAPIRRVNDPATGATINQGHEAATFHKEPWRPTGQLLTQFSEHTDSINRVVAAPDHAFFVTASDDGTCKIWDTTRLEKNVTPRSRYTHRHAQGARVKSLCFIENTHTFLSGADDGNIHAVRVEYRNVDGGENVRYGKPILVRDYQIRRPNATSSTSKQQSDDVEQPEYAVWMHHYRSQSSQSILLVATNNSRVLMIDMKNMDILHSMENPIEHGAPTTFCVDKRHHWLLLGTTHGILDLWDLRFRLRLRSFGLGGAAIGKRIERLLVHPSKGHGRWVVVSSGGEISVWDIEKMVCREVLRSSTFVHMETSGSGRAYEAWSPDEEASEKILERFAKDLSIDQTGTLLDPALRTQPQTQSAVATAAVSTGSPQARRVTKEVPSRPQLAQTRTNTTNTTITTTTTASRQPHKPQPLTISAVAVLTDYLLNPSQPENPNKSSIILTAGSDRTIRYWDLAHIDQSFILSGPLANNIVGVPDSIGSGSRGDRSTPINPINSSSSGESESQKIKVRYETSWPTSMSLSGLIQLVEEKVGVSEYITTGTSSTGKKSGTSTPTRKPRRDESVQSSTVRSVNSTNNNTTATSSPGGGAGVIATTNSSGANKTTRSSIISTAQQQLLKTHLDCITDVMVLKKPYGMVVSVNRMGGVYIFC